MKFNEFLKKENVTHKDLKSLETFISKKIKLKKEKKKIN